MSKGIRIGAIVLTMFFGLSFLHVWLNIGFDRFYFTRAKERKEFFRVGFLPVT